MNKKILVLSGSPRSGANSDILCDQFIKGAKEAGHSTEKIVLAKKTINYCVACDACQRNGGTCIHKDDMPEILEKMLAADVLVVATPIYFYSMVAQMKTLIDRVYAKFADMRNKEIYFLMTCAADAKSYMESTLAGLRGFADCLPGAVEKGVIYGFGVVNPGDIRNTQAMKEAFEVGKNV